MASCGRHGEQRVGLMLNRGGRERVVLGGEVTRPIGIILVRSPPPSFAGPPGHPGMAAGPTQSLLLCRGRMDLTRWHLMGCTSCTPCPG